MSVSSVVVAELMWLCMLVWQHPTSPISTTWRVGDAYVALNYEVMLVIWCPNEPIDYSSHYTTYTKKN